MMRANRILWLLALVALVAGQAVAQSSSQARLSPQDELDAGVAAYKAQHYEQAIQHFRNAVSLDPSMLNAHLYLATAYAQMYIPGAETVAAAESAIKEYSTALQLDPRNVIAMKGIAWLDFNMKRFEQATQDYRKILDVAPSDSEACYSIAVIDWTQSYRVRMEQRAKAKLEFTDSMIHQGICSSVRSQNWDRVQDGIEMLKKALKLRPDYDDAMAYLNLLYRERADIQCGDDSAQEADLKLADDWVDKTMSVKRAKAEGGRTRNTKPVADVAGGSGDGETVPH